MDDAVTPLPYFGAPPAREPKPARVVPALRGKRVVLSRGCPNNGVSGSTR